MTTSEQESAKQRFLEKNQTAVLLYIQNFINQNAARNQEDDSDGPLDYTDLTYDQKNQLLFDLRHIYGIVAHFNQTTHDFEFSVDVSTKQFQHDQNISIKQALQNTSLGSNGISRFLRSGPGIGCLIASLGTGTAIHSFGDQVVHPIQDQSYSFNSPMSFAMSIDHLVPSLQDIYNQDGIAAALDHHGGALSELDDVLGLGLMDIVSDDSSA